MYEEGEFGFITIPCKITYKSSPTESKKIDMKEHNRNIKAILRATHDMLSGGKTKIVSVGGGAGTGKTTLIKMIINTFKLKSYEVLTVAPTGTAAKRLFQVLREYNISTKTIHSSLYRMDEGVEVGDYISYSIKHRDEFPKEVTLLIIDEGSMVNEDIMNDIEGIGFPTVILGDINQLSPIDGETNKHTKDPMFRLSVCHRQKVGSKILDFAYDVLNMSHKYKSLMILKLDCKTRPLMKSLYKKYKIPNRDEKVEVSIYDGVQEFYEKLPKLVNENYLFICGMHRTRNYINRLVRDIKGLCPIEREYPEEFSRIKKMLGYNPMYPQVNDIIISKKNIYMNEESSGSMLDMIPNGGMYRITRIHEVNPKEDLIRMNIKDIITGHTYSIIRSRLSYFFTKADNGIKEEDEQMCKFDYAYCITGHASQGSEHPNVAVLVDWGDDIRSWLYTTVTRAKEKLRVALCDEKIKDNFKYDDVYPKEMKPFIEIIKTRLAEKDKKKKKREIEEYKKKREIEESSTLIVGKDVFINMDEAFL